MYTAPGSDAHVVCACAAVGNTAIEAAKSSPITGLGTEKGVLGLVIVGLLCDAVVRERRDIGSRVLWRCAG
jgi:hypothetical protein